VWWSEDGALGRRPVLVLARDSALPVLTRPLVAPLTTRIRGIPTEVALDQDDGLPRPCVVSLDNVQPLAASLLTERIARLGPERMAAVCQALKFAVDCP
jgi:mRNA interferase MazF